MKRLNKIMGRKARETTPVDDSLPDASTSTPNTAPMNDKMTKMDILQNTSAFLEVLKNVGDASQVLGPLKAICGVLKIATDTAVVRQFSRFKFT